jgi:hypothetical protein
MAEPRIADWQWLNLAPALFECVRVVRNEGLAVGPENLSERRITNDPVRGLRANDTPLITIARACLEELSARPEAAARSAKPAGRSSQCVIQ